MPQRYVTVVSLSNVELAPDTVVKFSDGIVFTHIPEFVTGDTEWLARLGNFQRQIVLESHHAFVSEYDCEALGEPDPRWKGGKAKSKQQVKEDLITLANFALWLSEPTSACMGPVFHCREHDGEGHIQQSTGGRIIYCHPDDASRRLTLKDVENAAKLHRPLVDMHLSEGIWTPTLIALSFLQMYQELSRYLLCWVGLESLFGPDDSRELSYRIVQRIGFFLGTDRLEARQIFETAKVGYALRSKLAHGRWKYDPKTTARMRDAEDLIRKAFKKILVSPDLLQVFSSDRRERHLDSLVFT